MNESSEPMAGGIHDTLPAESADSVPGEGGKFELERGQTVQRYSILERVGSGGMGVVYAAYDPDLDRKVALKFLHSHKADSPGRARLLREAKALARLNHANVITVHDVGTYRTRVFVAMEFVDGVSLGEWVSAKRRTWREILHVVRFAGRGLHAAHKAGLIHRDFKPDNVLIRRSDDRVLVLDFGLARQTEGYENVELSRISEAVMAGDLDAEITTTGAVVGTPAYMAPEQHLGESTDARTDQFAFCLVLWEALFGQHPFWGKSPVATAVNVLQGNMAESPRSAEVPGHVRRILLRGLQIDPDERYPSLKELLAELFRDHGAARRRWLVGGALAGLVGLGSYGAFELTRGTPDPCTGADSKLTGVWDDDRKEAVRGAFAATERAFAAAAWVGVEQTLDRYTLSWVDMHTDACEATKVRQEFSDEMLDLRMACLERRLSEVRAITEAFARADEGVVKHAVQAAQSLSRLAGCADLDGLAARVKPPADQRSARRVGELRTQLDAASAHTHTGKHDEAIQIIEAVMAEADDIGYQPLRAEALLLHGVVLEAKGEYAASSQRTLEAIWAAEATRHEEVAADAWIHLVWVDGVERKRIEDGHRWAQFARASLQRLGPNELRDASLTHNLGGVFYRERRHEEALAHYKRALDLQERILGPDHPSVARTLNHIGNTLMETRQLDEARKYCERSRKIRSETLGQDHPLVGAALNNLAETYNKEGRPDDALEYAEMAHEIVAGTGGPEEMTTLSILSRIHRKKGETEHALDEYGRMLTIRSETLGAKHHGVSGPLMAMGELLEQDERYDEALAHFGKALAIRERTNIVDAAKTQRALGRVWAKRGEKRAALELHQRALEVLDRELGSDHEEVARSRDAIRKLRRGG